MRGGWGAGVGRSTGIVSLTVVSNAQFDSHTLSVNELHNVGSEWEMEWEMGSLLEWLTFVRD